MKYLPVCLDPFSLFQHSRMFLAEFVGHDKYRHHHAGIGPHTPADVAYGYTGATTEYRIVALPVASPATPIGSAPP